MKHNSSLSYLLHVGRAVRYRCTTVLGKLVLRSEKIGYGQGLVLKGIPRVKRNPKSTITLGDQVTIVSYSMDTALGVNHAFKMETLEPGAVIHIGNDIGISGGTLCAVTHIELGDRCLLGANVMIVDSDFHPVFTGRRRHRSEGVQSAPVIIEENVFLGADVHVLKGVRIGRNSIIGAGSVVSKSIPPNCIAAGNPARVLRTFTEDEIRMIESDS